MIAHDYFFKNLGFHDLTDEPPSERLKAFLTRTQVKIKDETEEELPYLVIGFK